MNTIVVNQVQSNKSENMVWVVSIKGIEGSRQYCKSPRSAMKYMFLLKTRTGVRISKEGLQMLSAEIAKAKQNPEGVAKIQQAAEAIAEAHDINKIKEKKAKPAEAPAEKPAPKKRGRKLVQASAAAKLALTLPSAAELRQ